MWFFYKKTTHENIGQDVWNHVTNDWLLWWILFSFFVFVIFVVCFSEMSVVLRSRKIFSTVIGFLFSLLIIMYYLFGIYFVLVCLQVEIWHLQYFYITFHCKCQSFFFSHVKMSHHLDFFMYSRDMATALILKYMSSFHSKTHWITWQLNLYLFVGLLAMVKGQTWVWGVMIFFLIVVVCLV